MKEKVIKEIEKRIKEETNHMEFNLFSMDTTSDYKDYYHQEYLICYYKVKELEDLLDFIENGD